MAFDYAETAQDALDALADAGAPATITRTAPGAYNAATGTTTPSSTASVTAYGAIFDYNLTSMHGNQPDALIRAGDRQLLLAAIDVNGEPVLEAHLPIDAEVVGPDGSKYTIKNVRPLAPAGVAVMFDVQVKRP